MQAHELSHTHIPKQVKPQRISWVRLWQPICPVTWNSSMKIFTNSKHQNWHTFTLEDCNLQDFLLADLVTMNKGQGYWKWSKQTQATRDHNRSRVQELGWIQFKVISTFWHMRWSAKDTSLRCSTLLMSIKKKNHRKKYTPMRPRLVLQAFKKAQHYPVSTPLGKC